ncbi:MAG: hypothetical protein DLM53_05860 [Candidatus Eremiobacter antarcticus]|nr:hypothetical protein [Candidatus Eremiobacteraeota bacterium]PZR62344.1 MAG: hypothetical protein DLM53_05860 [Candidatus Eremiobacter sp. RRmetagenome_bin22]
MIEHLGMMMGLQQRFRLAALLLGYAKAGYESTGSLMEFTEQSEHDRLMELLQRELDPDQLASAIAEGRALDDEQAVAEARAALHPVS